MKLIIHYIRKQIRIALRYLLTYPVVLHQEEFQEVCPKRIKAVCCSGDHTLRLSLNVPEEDLRFQV